MSRPARRRRRGAGAALVVAAALGLAAAGHAGSTEPDLALAAAAAEVDQGVVTLELLGNFAYGDFVRLGYPIAVVLSEGTAVARLGLDGSVTVAENGGTPAPVPGAPGVVAIAPDRLAAVVPAALVAGGAATVVLEATFDGTTLRSNAVDVQW